MFTIELKSITSNLKLLNLKYR